MRRTVLAATAAFLVTLPSFAGTFTEIGDAGDLVTNYRTTTGSGFLDAITGRIASGTDADLFLIYISQPAIFQALATGFDTQLFLFQKSGHGVMANDDGGGGLNARLRNVFPSPSVSLPGFYLLGITSFDRDPVSLGGLIFPSSPFSPIYGPTGPGGGQPLSGWTGTGGTGNYVIRLTGVEAGAVTANPEPGTLVMLGAGLVGLAVWRRRRA